MPNLPPTPQHDWKQLEEDFAKGEIGFDLKDCSLRPPEDDEYVTDEGRVEPIFNRIHDMKRKRPLAKLSTLTEIQQELGKLYGDVHHGRIGTGEFTKRAYALGLLAQIMKAADKMKTDNAAVAAASVAGGDRG